MEERTVMFLPQLRGAFWLARSPFGPIRKGCQRGVRRTLIHKHKALGLDRGDHHFSKSRSQEFVALTRTQRPFFRPKPICLNALERVDSLTLTPATRSKYSCLSESLANGRSSTSASRSLLAFSSSLGLLPGAFPGESERPSRTALA